MGQWERIANRVRKDHEINLAIIEGLEKSDRMGYKKPYDTAIGILASLKKAGYKVTRIPRREI